MGLDANTRPTDGNAFPMDVDCFLKGNYLQRADIVLKRGTSIFSRLIRFATKSPFSHVGLVFLIPDRHGGFDKTFTIDAILKGVSVGDLGSMVGGKPSKKKPPSVIILRLEKTWFTVPVQKTVRGRVLHFIEAGYDFRTIARLAWSVLVGMALGRARFRRSMFFALSSRYRSNGRAPAEFICSGLVNYGFLKTLYDLSQEPGSGISEEDLKEVIFDPKLKGRDIRSLLGPDSRADLLSTTPEDISHSPSLSYRYAIVDGMVYEVTDRNSAIRLL